MDAVITVPLAPLVRVDEVFVSMDHVRRLVKHAYPDQPEARRALAWLVDELADRAEPLIDLIALYGRDG